MSAYFKTKILFMSDTTSPLLVVIEGLEEVRKGASLILQDQKFKMIRMSVDADLTRIVKRLQGLAGSKLRSEGETATTRIKFPPIQEFMGEQLSVPKPVQSEDLNPDDAERDNFLYKVNKLYSEIDTLSPAGILEGFSLPEDILVIRGVAKLAGVEDYEDREVNERYIADIIKAIVAAKEEGKNQQSIDEELQKQEKRIALNKELEVANSNLDKVNADLITAQKVLDEADTEAKKKKAAAAVAKLQEQQDDCDAKILELMDQLDNL